MPVSAPAVHGVGGSAATPSGPRRMQQAPPRLAFGGTLDIDVWLEAVMLTV
ncbi:hypothetical protein GCM10010104_11570 [Streptomyces indiaensis]|uniref:Uncharacterized protein n=1 Tax=Streptomyces indiaensis TaxID=284033 RepID=A0ABN3D7J7_9ACTN